MGPPFPHDDAALGAVEAAATDLDGAANGFAEVSDDLRARASQAQGYATGSLTDPVGSVAADIHVRLDDLISAARWAADVHRYYKVKVTDFNRGVDDLNAQWEAGVADSFGVQAPYVPGFTDPEQAQQMQEEHEDEVAAARSALEARLRREHTTLVNNLRDDGDTAASMLTRGPNAADIARMAEAGVLGDVVDVLQSGFEPVGFASGALVGTTEEMYRYLARNYMRTVPGRFDIGTWVRPHTRTLANGTVVNVRGYYRGQRFYPPTVVEDTVARARYLRFARVAKVGGAALGFATAAWDEWSNSEGRPTDERIGRTVTNSVTVGGAALAGAAVGASIGSAVPILGTAVGGLVGAAIGGAIASGVVDHFNDGLVDFGGEVGDKVGDAVEEIGDFADAATDKVGDAISSINPFD